MNKKLIKILPVIILALAIGLSPSFSLGRLSAGRIIEIRVEDILIAILGLIWIANFLISGKEKSEKPPLFFPILAWLGVGLFSLLINWMFTNLAFSESFFFFLKEVEFFFLYFYLFYHIKSFNTIKLLIKSWIFIGLFNVCWIFYHAIRGLKEKYYHYGYTPIIEPEGPFPAGGFFLLLFIFLFNILLYYYFSLKISKFKKTILTILCIIPVVGIFSSGSRASIFGFIFALFLILLFYSLKKDLLKPLLIAFLVLVVISSIFIFSHHQMITRISNIENLMRNFSLENVASRPSIWISRLTEMFNYPLTVFFGLGKSALEESHSQYVRNFIETGIVGSLMFLILMFVILKKSWQEFTGEKDPFLVGLCAGLLVTTLTMLFISISAGPFIVVKIAEVYWFFVAMSLTAIYLCQKKRIEIKQNLL